MTFKVDENLPVEAGDLLRAASHHAVTTSEEGLTGADDTLLMERLKREQRALVTLDLDFADVRTYPPQDHPGIVVVRAKRQDKTTVLALVQRFIPLLDKEPLAGRLWIVEADRVRIRESAAP